MRERQGTAFALSMLLLLAFSPLSAQDAAPAAPAQPPISSVPGLEEVTAQRVRNVVVLEGQVAREADRELAERVAKAESGVADVVNRIEVDRSAGARVLPALKSSGQRLLRLVGNLPLLLVALLVTWLAWRIGGWIAARPFIGTRMFKGQPFLADLARQVVRIAAGLAGLLIALEILDAMALAAALLGSAGVVGIALGFAFRDLLENYIASVLLSLRQPFAPDDYVRIDTYEGTVVGMNSRATVLMTADGNHLRLPNALVFKAVTTNFTRNGKRRFVFTLPLAPGSQAQEAMSAGLEAVRGTPDVLQDPAPFVELNEVTRDELRLMFFGWVDQRHGNFGRARSEAMRRTRARLKTMGVDFGPPAMRLVTEAALPVAPPAHENEAHEAPEPHQDEQQTVREAVRRTRAEMAGTDLLKESAERE